MEGKSKDTREKVARLSPDHLGGSRSEGTSQSARGDAPGADALTLTTVSRSTGEIKIMIILLADRLLKHRVKAPETMIETDEWREDGMSRVAVVLAHEVYGNTQYFLENDPRVAQTIDSRREGELRAFRASIEYIDRILAPDSEIQKMGKSDIRDAIIKHHRSLRKQEEAMLESWKKAK